MYSVKLVYNNDFFTAYELERLDRIKISWVSVFRDAETRQVKHYYITNIRMGTSSGKFFLAKSKAKFEQLNKDKLLWCCETCVDDFGVKFNNRWYFKNKNDMILFKLTWG